MIHSQDAAMQAHVLRFDSVVEVFETARRINEGVPSPFRRPQSRVAGAEFSSWEGFRKALFSPWSGALEAYGRVTVAVAERADMADPLDITRKARWDELEGEVDVDRAMHGDPDCLRRVARVHRPKAQNVVLYCNVDTTANTSHESLFWKAAAMCAAVDLLENAGYCVEVWAYSRANSVYKNPEMHRSFICWRLKEAGNVFDPVAVVNGLSVWFLMNAVYGSMPAAGPCKGLGDSEQWLGSFINTIDSEFGGAVSVGFPNVYGFDGAVETVKAVIESVNRRQLPPPPPPLVTETTPGSDSPSTNNTGSSKPGKQKRFRPAPTKRSRSC